MSSTKGIDRYNVVLRLAGPGDERELERLAQLDSASVPAGPVWIAILDGTAMAAYSAIERRSIADPWHPTAHLVELLEAHVLGARGAVNGSASHGWRRHLTRRAPWPA